ncbi:site-specific integrase [Methylocystis sp. IM3]|uniref:site-specific integrase n=1 Tax=unclassified Methylocystis TaxID=2625913 RepID=UPI0030FBEA0E
MATLRKRGSKWQVQVRREGHNLSKTFHLKEDALRWARERELSIDRGELISSGNAKVASGTIIPTLSDVLGRYQRDVLPAKRSAGPIEDFHLRAVLRHEIADTPLSEFTSVALARYRDDRLRVVSSGTVNRELGIVQHALKVAREEWGHSIAPTPIKKPSPGAPRQRRLNDDELAALRTALGKCRNPWVKPAFLFALATGMRRGEVLSLTWANVDIEAGIAFLPMTKNGHPRSVPLSPQALSVLLEFQRGEGDIIFPISANSLRLAWERVKRRAGVMDLRFHDLRHEAISRFFEQGLSVPEVGLISGHRDPRMLFRYTHLRSADVAKKLRLL